MFFSKVGRIQIDPALTCPIANLLQGQSVFDSGLSDQGAEVVDGFHGGQDGDLDGGGKGRK